jgi:hypothetical protein
MRIRNPASLVLAGLLCGSPGVRAADVTPQLHVGYFEMADKWDRGQFMFDGPPGGLSLGAGVELRPERRSFVQARLDHFRKTGTMLWSCGRDGCTAAAIPTRYRMTSATLLIGLQTNPERDVTAHAALGGGAARLDHRRSEATRGNADWTPAIAASAGIDRRLGHVAIGFGVTWLSLPGAPGFRVGAVARPPYVSEFDMGGLSLMVRVRPSRR